MFKPLADVLAINASPAGPEAAFFEIGPRSGRLILSVVGGSVRGPPLSTIGFDPMGSFADALARGAHLAAAQTKCAAAAGLWHGGAYTCAITNAPTSAVAPQEEAMADLRERLLDDIASLVASLHGLVTVYPSSGVSQAEMDALHAKSRWVAGVSRALGGLGDSATHVARGTMAAVAAGLRVLGTDGAEDLDLGVRRTAGVDLFDGLGVGNVSADDDSSSSGAGVGGGKGVVSATGGPAALPYEQIRVGVHGIGAVGSQVLNAFLRGGTTWAVCSDVDPATVNEGRAAFMSDGRVGVLRQASADSPLLFRSEVDVLMVCSDNGVLNDHTIPLLDPDVRLVVPSVLAAFGRADTDAATCHQRGVPVVPDFISARMGTVLAAAELAGVVDPTRDGFVQRHYDELDDSSIAYHTQLALQVAMSSGLTPSSALDGLLAEALRRVNPTNPNRGRVQAAAVANMWRTTAPAE